MKPDSVSAQVFSLATVAIMISSAWFMYLDWGQEGDIGGQYVPVWAREQLPFDTNATMSSVLFQGQYELLETENEWDSVHVMVPYNLPIGEGGAAVTLSLIHI